MTLIWINGAAIKHDDEVLEFLLHSRLLLDMMMMMMLKKSKRLLGFL
jgi:hypothetical protein